MHRNLMRVALALALAGWGSVSFGQLAGPVKITMEQALQLALEHNHNLLAARTTIQQNQAQEITANLRPNPVFSWDAQFLPIFNPGAFNADYINNTAQFDLGISYLIERGKKRQARWQAAKDQTAVTTATVTDNERTLIFSTAMQFVAAELAESNLDFAQQDLKSFQNTVDIGEARYKAGDISEGDFLKIKLQLLQFQTDVSSAQLARVQALASLRQFLGYGAVPADYDVAGEFTYQPLHATEEDLEATALRQRPDFRAAQLGVTAAQSQNALAVANGKRDLTASFDYSHVSAVNTGSIFFNIQLPLFDRNQGEIARTRYAVDQAQELQRASSDLVMTDVKNAFEGVRENDQVLQLYQTGYLDQAKQSRDISEYAYKRGAASLLDFLDAERSYRSTQLAYRQSLAAYLLALEQLREAAGVRTLP
jgi:outer membrane protein, heavy metal efflux system